MNDAGPATILTLEGVSKSYDSTLAVDNVFLEIREGEFFALLGPSGCGKTTLLRVLAGFETPSAGRILLDGSDIASIPPHRRPFNMMFQSYALFPHMTVERNVGFGLRQEHVPKEEIAERVDRVLDLVQLSGFRRRKPHQLSGGQKQRAALARALVKQPRILLLDEPLGALDKKLRQETQIELVNLQESLGITFVVVTHDQEEAMTVADRIAVMDHGKIAQVAAPSEIYEAPASRYVADFIGEANLLEGRVEEREGGCLRFRWGPDPVLCRHQGSLDAGAEACLALRPEKIRVRLLHDGPPPDAANSFQAKVEDILYVGNLSTYRMLLSDGRKLVAQAANENRLVDRGITWEDLVWAHWTEDAGVLLTC